MQGRHRRDLVGKGTGGGDGMTAAHAVADGGDRIAGGGVV